MKLNIDLSALFACVHKMGVNEFVDIDLNKGEALSNDFDMTIQSRQGFEIDIDLVELTHGVLSFNGKQVLLFIPHHTLHKFDSVLMDPNAGNKYHLTDCKTLTEMKEKGRFARYHVTTNKDGYFQINDGISRTEEVRLNVCKNCLDKINYKNYRHSPYQHKNKVFREFNLNDFFAEYQTYFQNVPEYKNQDKIGYTKNWQEISDNYRKEKQYCCENCRVDLSSHRSLLHTHHKDGNKQNNDRSNLKALCVECHSKEPDHGHLYVPIKDINILHNLRQKQGL
ncbi:HNH endonuclease [Pasteurella sp. PK-2025]|uniref:HNH endonuclease n=1 Tax=Pasteurella sp. PK-2025 TaxID=3413133 RepID=UPI003C78478A